jgi:hypothetical protein
MNKSRIQQQVPPQQMGNSYTQPNMYPPVNYPLSPPNYYPVYNQPYNPYT